MKRSKFTEEQIAFALHQADTGVSVEEVCRKVGISHATFYAWKRKFGGMGVWGSRSFGGCANSKRRTASSSSLLPI